MSMNPTFGDGPKKLPTGNAERGWGKPKQDVVIDDDRETSGFRIVYRQWPEGYDPMSKGERLYQKPAPSDKSVHGKLALPSLKGPTPHENGNGPH